MSGEAYMNDAGHGADTWPIYKSKGVPGLAEHDFNTAVAREAHRLLSGTLPVIESQPIDGKHNDVPLITRTNYFNSLYSKYPKAIGISNHANAGVSTARGFGVFYWDGDAASKRFAEIIIKHVKAIIPELPMWGSGLFVSKKGTWSEFHMCREPKMPFVLVEWAFMTHHLDFKLLTDDGFRKKCGLVIQKAVLEYQGLSEGSESPSKVVSPPKTDVKSETSAATPSGQRVESIYKGAEGLNFYTKPSFDTKYKAGTLAHGYGFPAAVRKLKVDGAEMYEVKNSKGATYYITASPKYVKLEGKGPVKTPSPKPAPAKNSSKAKGRIKIVGVKKAAYVQDQPDRKVSKELGEVKKGSYLEVAGSVRGKHSESGYWEVFYKGRRGYVTGEYGKYEAY
ncbi:N-acetylmuramoyl-L-alanine amidase family protein [Rossellomorea marisflavi]|uniref:N-acetylmuramoyl-L-alanine amidase family protein n=1 Tax=Rossellomorea marisflavi TaxID=189381 RepID=UPI0039BF72BE